MFSVSFYILIGFILLLAVFLIRQYRLQRRIAERRARREEIMAQKRGEGDA